jgi:DNA-binding response OmpR family regulator
VNELRAPCMETLRLRLRLSPLQSAMLSLLLSGVAPTRAQMQRALGQAGSTGGSKSTDVHIYFLRQKLEGVARIDSLGGVESYRGKICFGGRRKCVGYALDPEGRARLVELAKPHEAIAGQLNPAWRLSPAQGAIALRLMRGAATQADLHKALASVGCTSVTRNTLSKHIYDMRAKLRVHGLRVDNIWGRGWRFDDESVAKLNAASTGRAR